MGDVKVDIEYLSVGGNRQTAAADWNSDGTVAFGTDINIALWRPNVSHGPRSERASARLTCVLQEPISRGVHKLLTGHKELVKAVRFLPAAEGSRITFLVSGGDDQCVKLWRLDAETGGAACIQTVHDHTAPINCIASLGRCQASHEAGKPAQGPTIFATGAADATIKIWGFDGHELKVLQTIKTSPKYFPLAVALSILGDDGKTYVLASAGTRHTIQIYVGTFADDATTDFSLQATLAGHEGWIRSLDFARELPHEPSSDLLLASASQDKYIRLWRIHQGTELPAQAATASDPTVGAYLPGKSPSNKAHRFRSPASGDDFSVTFESLLFNHDDWIYSACWHAGNTTANNKKNATPLRLLSASADNSLAVWECDPDSGIWVTSARLGEISREKGATTATGSIGGFWTGLWSPSGTSILTLGRTGSWRLWDWDADRATWAQQVAASGHVRPVTGIAWSRSHVSSTPATTSSDSTQEPHYLLSTSADQTTRLHARWADRGTWHEMARPQIHGYDLNCVDALGPTRFVSGADEKLMRVFDEPRAVARLLRSVAQIGPTDGGEQAENAMPDAANIPVLGLSNKATTTEADGDVEAPTGADTASGAGAESDVLPNPSVGLALASQPPLEETLSRHTLWPEAEKLYGHGYEISCLAASHDGRLVASACRASSLNHAVVRIFETTRWTELRPPLAAHTLTATRLRFSHDDALLLSVGRDRQWAVFARGEEAEGQMPYTLLQAEPKGHTRMILDAAWAPIGDKQNPCRGFATAGRDKCVKVWAKGEDGKFVLAATMADDQPVTAVDFLSGRTTSGNIVLASGNEAGKIRIHVLRVDGSEISVLSTSTMSSE